MIPAAGPVAPPADWGLSTPEPSRSWSKTLAIGVVLALTGTAGTLLWRNYSPLLTPGEEQETAAAEGEAGDSPAEIADDSAAADLDSEFDELDTQTVPRALPQKKPLAGSSRQTAADDDELPPDEALYRDDVPAKPPIRRVAAVSPATSRSSLAGGRDARRAASSSDFDDLANGAGDDEEVLEAPPEQSEPGEDELEESETAAVPRSINLPRRGAADQAEIVDFDADSEEGSELPAQTSAQHRLHSSQNDEESEDAAPPRLKMTESDDPPKLRLNRPSHSDEVGGNEVELASPRGRGIRSEAVPASMDEFTQNMDDDDTPSGYVAVDPRERRALSRTVVKRPSELDESELANSDSSQEIDDASERGRSARDPDRVAITPRGRPVASRHQAPTGKPSTDRGFDRADQRAGEPVPATYRVESNDTYWSISKKVYGSPRFFQALAEHNRSRVAEPELLRPGIELETPAESELIGQYAKYIPRGGQLGHTDPLDDADAEHQPRIGVATPSPTRRVGGRPVPGDALRTVDEERRPRPSEGAGFHIGRSGEPMYRVGDGDTLSSIAQQHLGKSSRSYELYQLNQDRLADPDRLRVGTVLKLPTDASRVGVVSRGERIR